MFRLVEAEDLTEKSAKMLMGVTAIRYIDDILMVSPNEADLEAAVRFAEKTLTGFGFGLYNATDGSGKSRSRRMRQLDHFSWLHDPTQPVRTK